MFGLPEEAYLDMGDFVGGLLKYLRTHPVERLTIAGGFAKLSKLAEGAMDLHSARSQIDHEALAARLGGLGADAALVEKALAANTANEVLALAQKARLPLADAIAQKARDAALDMLKGKAIEVDILITDRAGNIVGAAR